MHYNFSRPLYQRVLRDISPNSNANAPNSNTILIPDLKIERPPTKSIYTEEESRVFIPFTLATELSEGEEDIDKFIEGSKSLKQKIYEKLEKKRIQGNQRMIKEATFRPTQMKRKSENEKNKSMNILRSCRKSKVKAKREKTDLGCTWLGWEDEEKVKQISDLCFDERQKKTLNNRKQMAEKLKKQKQEKQMMACTFKPKLTSYPIR